MGQNSVMLEIESSSMTYRQKTSNSVYDKGTIPLRSNSDKKNRLFLRPQLSLKSKTNTNQQRIGCLVYPEITQISERSL